MGWWVNRNHKCGTQSELSWWFQYRFITNICDGMEFLELLSLP